MHKEKPTKHYTVTITGSQVFQLTDYVDQYSFDNYVDNGKCTVRNDVTGKSDVFTNDSCTLSVGITDHCMALINNSNGENANVEITVMRD